MKNFKNIMCGALLGLTLVSISSCERTLSDQTQYGPSYRPAPSDFSVVGDTVTPVTASIDFSVTPTTSFSATFSHEVSWTMTLTGQTSGAVKTITGLSNSLSAANTSWDGGANLEFFSAGEQVDVVVTFLASEVKVNTSLTVTATKTYDGQTLNGVTYTLIDDFEGNGYPLVPGPDGFDAPYTNFATDASRKIQGANSYTLSGTDVSGNFWCGDFFSSPLNAFAGKVTTTNPTELYVNAYVYGTGKPNTTIQIALLEVDDDDDFAASVSSPASYVYDDNLDKNDAWLIKQEVTHIGWKLLSFKYSQFSLAPDPTNGGGGNKIKEPHKVSGIRLSLTSDPLPNAEIEFGLDFVTITEGGKFVP